MVVGQRRRQHRDQARTVDRNARDARRVAAQERRQRDEHRHRRQRQDQAGEVDDGIEPELRPVVGAGRARQRRWHGAFHRHYISRVARSVIS